MGKNMNKLKNLQNAAKTKNKDEIERAFEEFYMMNYSLVCYIVNGYIHSPSDVEDVVSEAFLKLFNNLDRLDFTRNPAAYFATIIKNTTFSYMRTRDYKECKKCIRSSEIIYNWEDPYQQKNSKEEIIETISTVSDGVDLEIGVYRLVYGYRYKKIADILDMNINTVKSKHLRTMKKLKGKVDEDDFF